MARQRRLGSFGQAFSSMLGGKGSGAPPPRQGGRGRNLGSYGQAFGGLTGARGVGGPEPPPAAQDQRSSKWWLNRMPFDKRERMGLVDDMVMVPMDALRLALERARDDTSMQFPGASAADRAGGRGDPIAYLSSRLVTHLESLMEGGEDHAAVPEAANLQAAAA